MPSELIVRLQNSNGSFNCEKFDNLPSPRSVYLSICFTDNIQSEQLAIELKKILITEISNLESAFANSMPPCGGHIRNFNECQALNIPDNLKFLIVVSDGTSNTFADNSVLNWNHKILPVLPSGNTVNLPLPFNASQVAFWNTQIDEIIPTIFGILGISEEDQRIFISYRRTDTSLFAEQLFDRLNQEGFEVFLDRFSINPGINFQNRLYQELADKAMVIFLESTEFLNSSWVQLEIDFAKKYRLGLFAVNINNSNKIPSIDDEYREYHTLDPTSSQLDAVNLNSLIINIKSRHSIALYRKRNQLTMSVVAALLGQGANPLVDENGFITLVNINGDITKIWTTSRPPKVNDYHYSDTSCEPNNIKAIIGPEFQEGQRSILNSWLSTKSDVSFYNEGELLQMATNIYP